MTTTKDTATWRPNPGPQTQFLASSAYEVLFGGAAGGAKTESLIVSPLMRRAKFRSRNKPRRGSDIGRV